MRTLLALTLAAALLPTPALAQSGTMMTSVGPRVQPEFSARDLRVMTRVLELSPEGQQALQALYDAYADTLTQEGAAVRELAETEIERAELLNDATLLSAAHKRNAVFQKRAAELRAQFLEDLKSLLTREQDANWPILERELRRLKQIGQGKLTGESLDLVHLTEDAIGDRPMPPVVAELLTRYREDIDRALKARETFLQGDAKEFDDAVKNDLERAASIWKEAQERRTGVRDINERYARQIAAELSAEQRARFEDKIFELSFPMLIRPTRVDAYLAGALELTSLTAEQRAALLEVKARHEQQRRAWSRSAASGWRELESTFKPGPLAAALGEGPSDPHNQRYNGAWLPDSHPLTQARHRRLELDLATRSAIDKLLTPDQRADVPARTTGQARFENWLPWGI